MTSYGNNYYGAYLQPNIYPQQQQPIRKRYPTNWKQICVWLLLLAVIALVIVAVFIPIATKHSNSNGGDGNFDSDDDDDDDDHYDDDFQQHEYRDSIHRQVSFEISEMTGVADRAPPWFLVNGTNDTLYAYIGRHKYMFVHIQSYSESTNNLEMYVPIITVDTIISDANTTALPAVFSGFELGPYNSSCFNTIVPGLRWQTSHDVYIQTDFTAMNASCLTSSFVLCAFTQAWSKYQRSGQTLNPMRALIPTTNGFAGLVQNFRNDISFGAVTGFPNAQNILAVTSFWWDGTQLIEFDQIYNTQTYQYGNYDESPLSTLIDLENVMSHEICHVYGAKDTYDPGDCSVSTFYGYAAYRQINKRSLTIDDQEGLSFIYGGEPYEQTDQSICTYGPSLSNACLIKLGMPTVPIPTTTRPATTRPPSTNTASPTAKSSASTLPPTSPKASATTARSTTVSPSATTKVSTTTTKKNSATQSGSGGGNGQVQSESDTAITSSSSIKKNAANTIVNPMIYWQTMVAALIALFVLVF